MQKQDRIVTLQWHKVRHSSAIQVSSSCREHFITQIVITTRIVYVMKTQDTPDTSRFINPDKSRRCVNSNNECVSIFVNAGRCSLTPAMTPIQTSVAGSQGRVLTLPIAHSTAHVRCPPAQQSYGLSRTRRVCSTQCQCSNSEIAWLKPQEASPTCAN